MSAPTTVTLGRRRTPTAELAALEHERRAFGRLLGQALRDPDAEPDWLADLRAHLAKLDARIAALRGQGVAA